jgi:hypothetical protein
MGCQHLFERIHSGIEDQAMKALIFAVEVADVGACTFPQV